MCFCPLLSYGRETVTESLSLGQSFHRQMWRLSVVFRDFGGRVGNHQHLNKFYLVSCYYTSLGLILIY